MQRSVQLGARLLAVRLEAVMLPSVTALGRRRAPARCAVSRWILRLPVLVLVLRLVRCAVVVQIKAPRCWDTVRLSCPLDLLLIMCGV